MRSIVAFSHVGVADDVSATVPALLSDDFGWANGVKIEVNGGQHF